VLAAAGSVLVACCQPEPYLHKAPGQNTTSLDLSSRGVILARERSGSSVLEDRPVDKLAK
jgi:hypothetical protein